MTISRRLRLAVVEPGTSVDLYIAAIIIVFGLYCLAPTWMHLRFPKMEREMAAVLPLATWGLLSIGLGLGLMLTAIWRVERYLVVFYIVSFGFWLLIGWMFCIGTKVPAIEGITAPLSALLCLVRASQLPSADHRHYHA